MEVKDILKPLLCELKEIRRQIHRYPELAGREFHTAKLIRERLSETDIRLEAPYIGTDVVGILHGSRPGPNITLRADIDALPIQELTEVPWKSTVPNVMHACGHDSHAAILLGTALVLNKLRNEIAGSVRFVFQPGEEERCMGRDLVAAGAIANPPPQACFALHVFPGGKCGEVTVWQDQMTAYLKNFILTVSKDNEFRQQLPMEASAGFLAEYFEYAQNGIKNEAKTEKPVMVRFGRYSSGVSGNIYPFSCEVVGSLRYLQESDGAILRQVHEHYISTLAEKYGFSWKIEYQELYLPVVNAPQCNEVVKAAVSQFLGADHLSEQNEAMLSSEDFSFFVQEAPGAYFTIAMGDSNPSHAHYYHLNDDVLEPAILVMTAVVLNSLKSESKLISSERAGEKNGIFR